MRPSFTNWFRKFHSDEEGLEALQVVMIIALAAIVILVVATVGQEIVTWMQDEVHNITEGGWSFQF